MTFLKLLKREWQWQTCFKHEPIWPDKVGTMLENKRNIFPGLGKLERQTYISALFNSKKTLYI